MIDRIESNATGTAVTLQGRVRVAGRERPGELLADEVAAGAFPGAVGLASRDGAEIWGEQAGYLTYDNLVATSVDTVYDFASVSKVFISTLALILVEQGALEMTTSVGDVLAGYGRDIADVTLVDLLCHTSGLPSVPDLHTVYPTKDGLLGAIKHIDVAADKDIVYSSLNYMIVGWMLEGVGHAPLADLACRWIFDPLSLASLTYEPKGTAGIAPTEYSVFRSRVLIGEVHDDNAYVAEEPTGHTGIFGNIRDLDTFARALLNPSDRRLVFDRAMLLTPARRSRDGATCRTPAFVVDDPNFGSWPSPILSHTGFTGGSIALVPDAKLTAVILSNRVYPTRRNTRINGARRRVHQALADASGPGR